MRNEKFLKVLKFANQWQFIPAAFGFGWVIGDAIALDLDPTYATTLSKFGMLGVVWWFLISFLYIGWFGYSVDRKLTKTLESIEQERTKHLAIHKRLDDLRDRLIFEDNNQYWEILEELSVSEKLKLRIPTIPIVFDFFPLVFSLVFIKIS